MPLMNLHERVSRAFEQSGLSVSEFARRIEKRGIKKERSALSRMLRCQTSADTTTGELEIMAAELGLVLTCKQRRRAA